VHDAALAAGAREVGLIEEPMAQALGAACRWRTARLMIVDIGGGTTG
jgi:rod shape-determining protein MreB